MSRSILREETTAARLSRRDVLAASSGLVIAATLPTRGRGQSGEARVFQGEGGETAFSPNAFVQVSPDNLVTVLIKHIEFGQGPWTGLATLVADEMDADWSQIRAEHAPADAALYANAAFGMQGTGGSTAMATSFDIMRKAGAAARAMLVEAAATSWSVPKDEIAIQNGVISHAASGNSGTFGDFAEAAATVEPPADPILKTPDQFIYIGKEDLPKLDTHMKSTGAATFTLDVYRDGMVTAVVSHPPQFGATVASFDGAQAAATPGVVDVKQLSSGVAVYAENTFAALKGRKAVTVEWDSSAAETRSTDEIRVERSNSARTRGAVAGEAGDIDAGLAAATVTLEHEYFFPYLVHAPMEPLDAVIERSEDGGVDVWMGSQIQTADQQAIAGVLGLEPSKVRINTMLAGGSFGRRAQPVSQFAVEAAEAFKAFGGERPVKLMWTREDDIKGGFYRPMMVHRLRGGLDADNKIVAWEQVVAGQSFLAGSAFEGLIQNGIDATMMEGAAVLPYQIPNVHVSAHIINNPVPTLWWRSVGHTHTGYAVETFLDELLEKAGEDAVEGRLAMMTAEKDARLAGALRRVADLADWGRAPAEGRAFGVAAVESFQSFVAQIAEVSIEDGAPRVHKVWCAVDCGIAVNPEIIRAQMEGGIGYGLSAILFNELELDDAGRVRQSNFHDYRSLRINEMPDVEVAIIASDAAPTGVGEPGVPPIGPAVGNAVRRLTGQTPTRLPMLRSTTA